MTLPGLGSLPGLGFGSSSTPSNPSAPSATQETRHITVPANSEWRFEAPFNATTTVTIHPLIDTTYNEDNAPSIAELFGTELVPNVPYKFTGTKAAIYSPAGCRLEVAGAALEADYVADESEVLTYANVHFALENLRNSAAAARARNTAPDAPSGPRVLILGPENAGKTALVKTLTAYAVRSGRSPCVVNLDPREGMLAPPGSVSAAVFGPGVQLDVEDAGSGGWGTSGVSGAAGLATRMPLVYHVGIERPEEAMEIFGPVTTRLALAATSRYEDDEEVREAGLFVDLAGSVCAGKGGAEVIEHVISEFSITAILVLGSERTASDLLKKYPPLRSDPAAHPVILKLPKPGGAVDRDAAYMRALRTEQLKQYFFGTKSMPLSPHTSVLDVNLLQVFRMPSPEEAAIARQFRPGDAAGGGGPGYEVGPLTPAAAGCLLAIKHAGVADAQETVRDAAVLGFLYVAEVDAEKKRVRVLGPVGGRLPDRAMVLGRWPESIGELVG